jgi:3-oxoacyl-[acyl-carrier protein] reductase
VQGSQTAPLAGRIAVVTGSSRGIGRATALRLASMGADVAINYRSDSAGASETQAAAAALGVRAIAAQADVSQEEDVARLFQQVEAELGPTAILVNNAGLTRDKLILQMKLEDFDGLLAANLRSAFLCTRAAIRTMMRARWGRIVNVTSISGLMGQVGQANYAASKAGMIGFSKSLAQEVATRGITVNCVAPGFIESPMTDALTDQQKAAILATIPSGKLGQGADVAGACVYLASEEAGYVTGQTLHVNGGMAMI